MAPACNLLYVVLQALDRFKEDPNTVVLLASLRACGTGITVTCASEVVLMEPDWNPFVSGLNILAELSLW